MSETPPIYHEDLIRNKGREPVKVLLQPEEKIIELRKVKSVRGVLQQLNLPPCTAIVARGKELLTSDRAVYPGDELLVRKVASSG